MGMTALGTLLMLVALGLIVHEWKLLAEWRRDPDEVPYSLMVFARRACVSLLMMGFVALVRLQPVVLPRLSPVRAALYLSLYLVIVVGIFLLAFVDLLYHRRLARVLERQMSEIQARSLELIVKARTMMAEQEGHQHEEPRDDRERIPTVEDDRRE